MSCDIYLLVTKKRGGGGGKSLYDKLTPGVFISCCTMAHTHSYGVILLHNERTTARSFYLTLKIDSYTT